MRFDYSSLVNISLLTAKTHFPCGHMVSGRYLISLNLYKETQIDDPKMLRC